MNIKGPKGPGGPSASPHAAKPDTSKVDGSSFKEVLEARAKPDASDLQNTIEQVVAGLSQQVRAGATSPEQARQRLASEIAKAMGPMPDEMRARLETFLDHQLQSDPGLSSHASALFDQESE